MLGSLFGPIKYGILPDHLKREQLPAGNALVEGATFIAILLGTIVGGLAARGGGDIAAFAVLMIGFALACWFASLLIPPTGEGAPHLKINVNIFASTAAMIRHLRADPRLWWGALVTSWFWLVGIVVLSLLPPLIKNLIGGNEDDRHRLSGAVLDRGRHRLRACRAARARAHRARAPRLPAPCCSACSRSISASRPSARRRRRRRKPPARCFRRCSASAPRSIWSGLAISGGLFIVPAFAAVQAWAGVDYRARTIAAVNVLNAAFMTGATVVVAILQKFGATVPMLFLGIGVATLVVAALIRQTMPMSLLRDFTVFVLRAFYRLEVHGHREHRQSRAERHHRAQPCELPRSAGGDVAAAARTRSSPSTSASRSAGGSSRSSNSRARWRSIRSSRWRRARIINAVRERRDAGHLPGRPHHRHRQPDEGL